MASKSAIFAVKFIADSRNMSRELNALERGMHNLKGAVDRLTVPAGIAAGAMFAFGKSAASAAADAEQNFGAVNTVFKDAAGTVHKFAETSAQAVGMSASSYESLAASIGGSLQTAGYSHEEMAGKTNDLISAAADLSSVFGGDAVEAAGAMGAALRGEFDPLERFGVFMSMTAVNARMAAEGTDKLEGAAYDAAKKQAIVNEIMEQAATYQGNFAREADTAAGAQQRANAEFENAKAKLGEALLPLIVDGSRYFADFARWVSENSETVKGWALGVAGAIAVIFGLKGAITAIEVGMKLWTAAQWAFNAAASANPVGLIIVAVTALAAAFSWAYENVGWFRDGVDQAVQAISDWWNGLCESVVTLWQDATGAVSSWWETTTSDLSRSWNDTTGAISDRWNDATNFMSEKAQAFSQSASDAWGSFKRFFSDTMNNIGRFFSDIWRNINSFVSNIVKGWITKFWGFYRNVINIFRSVLDWVGGIRRAFSNIFSNFRPPKWVSNIFGSTSTGATFYGSSPLPETPFSVTATSNPLEAIFNRPISGQQVVNNHYYQLDNNFNGIVGDPLAVARSVQDLLTRLKTMTGGH